MKTFVGTALALALTVAALPAAAGDAKVGPLQIKGAWARATPPNAPAGGAFLSVTNTGTETDNLLSASAGVAKTVELHAHITQGDVMRMVAIQSVEVQPGKTVDLAPGGLHVMLIGLNKPLKEGDSFPMVLDFAKAGKVTVTVDVKALGAMGPGAGAMVHDPAAHQSHMQDPAHQEMHKSMHGSGN
ncbi:MAG TPA: copper chaperone PCu(A)C [Magnetospirillum sp.]|jgi:copper(I)-binding protein|nr:copper chaperone PCu(A)C [Magnetospirillum sp.]